MEQWIVLDMDLQLAMDYIWLISLHHFSFFSSLLDPFPPFIWHHFPRQLPLLLG